ncbi:MAG: prepilin-type N-terminal cleavage/methylation domain-containing protein [Chitinispirillaceae bacterium]|nr:prepilin-type N-terminal cleavage/methylation domain-containing protein [Chitinispirillaceae bacterium]
MKTIHANNRSGVTLVEVIIAGTVTAVVLGLIFYAVSFSGTATSRMMALQRLQLESSLISELFKQNVRNGSFICAGTGSAAPTADVDNLTDITVRNSDGSQAAYFRINGTTLEMNNSRYLTSYLCDFSTPATHFKVFQNGKQAEFYLSMYTTAGGEPIHYTATIGGLRCKN